MSSEAKRQPPHLLIAAAVCVTAAFAVVFPVWASPASTWTGAHGDVFKFMNWLAWVPHAIGHLQNPLFASAVDYPHGVNLTWDTPMPLAGAVMWPVTATLGPVVAFNVYLLLTIFLDSLCSYLWLRSHTRSRWPALIAGLLLALSPFAAAHTWAGHINLVSFWPLPLLLMCLERTLTRRRMSWRLGLAIGVLAAAQVYLAEELLAIFAIAAVVLVVVAAAVCWRDAMTRAGSTALTFAVGAAVFLVLAGPMLVFQYFGSGHITQVLQRPNVYVTDLVNLVVPTSRTLITVPALTDQQSSHWTGNLAESTGYIGVAAIALMVYAAVKWRRSPAVRVALITTVVIVILSLGPHLHMGGIDTGVRLPGEIFGHMPFLASLLPERLSLMIAFGIAYVVAVTLDRSLFQPGSRQAVGAALAVASVLLLVPVIPMSASSAPLPQYFTVGGGAHTLSAGTVALVVPYVDGIPEHDVPMLWQAQSDFRFAMVEGHAIATFGRIVVFNWPTVVGNILQRLQLDGTEPPRSDSLRAALRAELHQEGVTAIIAGPTSNWPAVQSFINWITGSSPQQMQGVSLWQNVNA